MNVVRLVRLVSFAFLFASLLGLLTFSPPLLRAARQAPAPNTKVAAFQNSAARSTSAPLLFIENVGQFDPRAKFQLQGANGTMFLADAAIWLTLAESTALPSPLARLDGSQKRRGKDQPPRQAVNLKITFVDAQSQPTIEPLERMNTRLSYFLGNEASQWQPDVPVWNGVRYKNVYPGVDLEVTSKKGQWHWRLMADRKKDVKNVRVRVEGSEQLALTDAGIEMTTAVGRATLPYLSVVNRAGRPFKFKKQPALTQDLIRTPFGSGLIPSSPNAGGTHVESNESFLVYSTFLGGSDSDCDYECGIAVGPDGSAYIANFTWSTDFPTTPGAIQPALGGDLDVAVSKLSADGSTLLYSTYLGGSEVECDYYCVIAVDVQGQVYVSGDTYSPNFPTTSGVRQTACGGCPNFNDVFVSKLNSSGTMLEYSTYLGGSDYDWGGGVALDANGAAYLTGFTYSTDFPIRAGAFQPTCNCASAEEAFVAKLNATASMLEYSTFLGGQNDDEGHGIAVDALGNAYVTGVTFSFTDFPTTDDAFQTTISGPYADAFVSKVNVAGSDLEYSTLLGGSDYDDGLEVTVDAEGFSYVTGYTRSSDFPKKRAYQTAFGGLYDGFVTKLLQDGSDLGYSTFLGGSERDYATGIAVNGMGHAFVTDSTGGDFPLSMNAYQPAFGGIADLFVSRLNENGDQLLYSTYLGGIQREEAGHVALDSDGSNFYIVGASRSADFPTTMGAYDRTCGTDGTCNANGNILNADTVVVKIDLPVMGTPTPTPTPTATATATWTPTATPTPSVPLVSLEVTQANGNPVEGLTMNVDGWYQENPIHVTVTLSNPSSTSIDLNGSIEFSSNGNPTRFYIVEQTHIPGICTDNKVQSGSSGFL